MTREHWGSRLGFIMATAGFAIGLGNIWRFPYVVGENGGGAFLMVYLACVILIGIPLITAEISLGRKSQLSPIAGMARLTGRIARPGTRNLTWRSRVPGGCPGECPVRIPKDGCPRRPALPPRVAAGAAKFANPLKR